MTEMAAALKDFVIVMQTLGPYGIVFYIWWDSQKMAKERNNKFQEEARKWEERFQAVRQMYENNVELVKNYEGIAKDLHATVVYNATIMTQVKDIADHNLYCPLIRKKSKQSEVDG